MQNLAMQEQLAEDGEQKLTFSANGGEYFRIWIVNLLLTIVTLGVYSAWAKVRRNQYFYSSTRLAGSSFEYQGNPQAILKGRIAAVVVFAAYNVAFRVSITAGLIMFVLMLALVPLAIWKSLQFKLHNTSYRGIRFGFDGSVGEAYAHFLLLPLLFGTGILAPLGHHRIKRFQHTESRFGTSHFRFNAPVSGFYKVYGLMLALFVGIFFLLGLIAASMKNAQIAVWFPLLSYVVLFTLMPLFFALIQNVIWDNTSLGDHEFRCNLKWSGLLGIYLTNLLGIVFTLGLFTPFAVVRSLKYRLESMSMIVNGSLDNFVAGEQEHIAAAGEGLADFMDFDLSL